MTDQVDLNPGWNWVLTIWVPMVLANHDSYPPEAVEAAKEALLQAAKIIERIERENDLY
jgi:hypothetical protein